MSVSVYVIPWVITTYSRCVHVDVSVSDAYTSYISYVFPHGHTICIIHICIINPVSGIDICDIIPTGLYNRVPCVTVRCTTMIHRMYVNVLRFVVVAFGVSCIEILLVCIDTFDEQRFGGGVQRVIVFDTFAYTVTR